MNESWTICLRTKMPVIAGRTITVSVGDISVMYQVLSCYPEESAADDMTYTVTLDRPLGAIASRIMADVLDGRIK